MRSKNGGFAMTDEELLLEIKNNPSKGFDLLLKEYSALAYKICLSVLLPVGTKEDAQECASDTFVTLFKNIEKVDLSRGTLKGFLAHSAKNIAIDRYRKLKRQGEFASLDEIEKLPSFDDTDERERRKLIFNEIRALGEPDSTILIRRYFLSQSAKEIGKALGMKSDAVQKRAERSKRKLKERLGGVLYE